MDIIFMVREKVDDAKLIMIMYLQTGFKEKIVQMYEVLLRGEDPQISFGQQFWNEFFLLKPKVGNKNTWSSESGTRYTVPPLGIN